MHFYAIVLLVVLAFVFLLSGPKIQFFSTIVAIMVSSFMGLRSNHLEEPIIMCIYLFVGIVFMLFFWALDNAGSRKRKNKYVTAVLSLILGSFGIHRFYLRRRSTGLLYLLFCWTNIPFYIGVLECIVFLFMPKKAFDSIYNSVTKSKEEEGNRTPAEHLPQTEENEITANGDTVKPADFSTQDQVVEINYTSKDGLVEARGTTDEYVVTVERESGVYRFYIVDGQMVEYKFPKMKTKNKYNGVE